MLSLCIRTHTCFLSLTLSLSLSLSLSVFLLPSSAVGTRDHPSLSQDPLPTSRHTDRFARRRGHNREALKGQAKANHRRISREARTRIEGSKIRRVLSSDTKGIEKCLRRGNSSRPRAPRASQEEEVSDLVRKFSRHKL